MIDVDEVIAAIGLTPAAANQEWLLSARDVLTRAIPVIAQMVLDEIEPEPTDTYSDERLKGRGEGAAKGMAWMRNLWFERQRELRAWVYEHTLIEQGTNRRVVDQTTLLQAIERMPLRPELPSDTEVERQYLSDMRAAGVPISSPPQPSDTCSQCGRPKWDGTGPQYPYTDRCLASTPSDCPASQQVEGSDFAGTPLSHLTPSDTEEEEAWCYKSGGLSGVQRGAHAPYGTDEVKMCQTCGTEWRPLLTGSLNCPNSHQPTHTSAREACPTCGCVATCTPGHCVHPYPDYGR